MKEENIIDLEKLEPDILDILPPYYFVLNQEIPHINNKTSDYNRKTKPEKQLKKSGRKRKIPLKDGEKTHGKNSSDNILRKIQVHYFSFIVDFANDLLKHLGYNCEFIELD